ncbi:cell division protein FtsA [Clostridium niameyense]|uniref:Cell division protein FtsA n=1 Tax=Clostridium niameyense TaxID=1622073 RepID=A0A6M0R844_9CLOT|nr:rod shape-determining protein [Clostridium niameyense]NEZ46393.1 cell division protein FtsA [Clostridium niameyense]
MQSMKVNSQNIIFALDVGTRSILGTVGIVKDKKFHILEESYIEHEERAMIDGQIHDVTLVASAVEKVKRTLEEKLNIQLNKVSIAAAGRFLKTHTVKVEVDIDSSYEIDKDTIRSLELTAVKKAEDEIAGKSQGKLYCVGYTVKNYYLNDYVISNLLLQKGEKIATEVIATFLPRYVIDSLYSVMKKVGLTVDSLTLEPIAAMEAAIPRKLRLLNLALVDVGAGTSDIAICSKDTVSAFGMVSLAGDEITEAIVQSYLVDFETAEKIKKQCYNEKTIEYTDVIGLQNKIESQEILKVIDPTVKKIADEIGNKILEINGDKSPNAVFLIGGGAHSPLLKEYISKKLNLPIERIAVKDRQAVLDCVVNEANFGSEGVTVLGIALTSIRRLGNDFIDVMLNGNIVSLFNSHKHTVMDLIIQGGISPKVLLGRNGKNIRFTLNNIPRVSFGTLSSNAVIRINGQISSVEDNVKEGDTVEIEFAKNGRDAEPTIKDYIKKVYSISFFINDIIETMCPLGFINGNKVNLNDKIKENDEVYIVFPETLGDYKKYYDDLQGVFKYYLEDKILDDSYKIKEGDRIYKIKEEKKDIVQVKKETRDITENKTYDEVAITSSILDIKEEKTTVAEEKKTDLPKEVVSVKVTANGQEVELKGKKEYIFVDIFNYIEFDLSLVRGNLLLLLNGKPAGYYDRLKQGDIVEIKWE